MPGIKPEQANIPKNKNYLQKLQIIQILAMAGTSEKITTVTETMSILTFSGPGPGKRYVIDECLPEVSQSPQKGIYYK